jgi:hypothetical protein
MRSFIRLARVCHVCPALCMSFQKPRRCLRITPAMKMLLVINLAALLLLLGQRETHLGYHIADFTVRFYKIIFMFNSKLFSTRTPSLNAVPWFTWLVASLIAEARVPAWVSACGICG